MCVCMCVGERETEKVRETEMKPHCIINYRLTVPDFRVPSLTQFWVGRERVNNRWRKEKENCSETEIDRMRKIDSLKERQIGRKRGWTRAKRETDWINKVKDNKRE